MTKNKANNIKNSRQENKIEIYQTKDNKIEIEIVDQDDISNENF